MTDLDTVTALAREVARALQPIAGAFEIPDDGPRDFLADLGWPFDTVPSAFASLRDPVLQVLDRADPDDDGAPIDGSALLESLRAVFQAIAAIGTDSTLPSAFRSEFPGQLVEDLLVRYLLRNRPRIGYLLMLLGILSEEDQPEANGRLAYRRRTFWFDGLAQLLSHPLDTLKSTYQWGHSDLATDRLLASIAGLFSNSAWSVSFGDLNGPATTALNSGALQADRTTSFALSLAAFSDVQVGSALNAGAGLFFLPETATAKPGFALLPFATGRFDIPVPISEHIGLRIESDLDLAGGAGLLVRPNEDTQFLLGLSSGSPLPAQGQLAVQFDLESPGTPFTLLGSPDASRFELAGVSTRLGTRLSGDEKLDVFAEFSLKQAQLVIQAGSGSLDSFLSSVLPDEGIRLSISPTLGVSTERGLYFSGSSQLAIELPLHVSLGLLQIQSVQISLSAADNAVVADLGATFKTTLGVVDAVVTNVGLRARFSSPSDRKGNLGPLQLDLGVRAPDGVALSLDARGVISGGGFLGHDPATGTYAGAMKLSLQDQMTLSAYGLIATRMPDGRPGYSLLVFITAEGFQPIPLGLGFMLTSIGGLIGVNRTFDYDVLKAGLKSDTLATLLFPRDPVGNAPALIQALAAAFPARPGSFLLGLLARITWFTPTLITLDLGLVLEVGARTRLLVLGRVSALLPTAENDLVRLVLDTVGELDFDAGTLSVDAMVVDSRLLHRFPITGSAAIRARWGHQAGPTGQSFVLAAGGFNPRFATPAGFPTLERLAISLTKGKNPRLVCESYFAITSNTLQFGARASLYAEAIGFSLTGEIGYDVLVSLAPLHFVADFRGVMQLKRGSHSLFKLELKGSLEGPQPLRLSGKVTFEIFWISFTVRVDATLAEGTAPAGLAAVNVADLLAAAVGAASSWRTQLTPGVSHGVALRSVNSHDGPVLDPLGQMVLEQQVVPLNLTRDVDIYGGAPVAGPRRFALTGQLNDTSATSVQGAFAPARFFALSDDEKLAAPSFEAMDAGLVLGDASIRYAANAIESAPLEYEPITLNPEGAASVPADGTKYQLPVASLTAHVATGAAAQAPIRQVGRARFRNLSLKPAATVTAPQWTIVRTSDGTPAPAASNLPTWSEQRAALNVLNRGGAEWTLVPTHELAVA